MLVVLLEVEMIREQLETVLNELNEVYSLDNSKILVIGCSTSEVIGEHIGTAGTMETAEEIYNTLIAFQHKTGVRLAFQCCEHLNRALVVSEEIAKRNNVEEVCVVPVRRAGGALASIAFNKMVDACMVEKIQADAGVDIGDTFIGMHLKPVAVPFRSTIKKIGQAHVTSAYTRPKLIGGARAIYEHNGDGNA